MNPQQLGSHLRCQMSAGGESRRSFPKTGMADFGATSPLAAVALKGQNPPTAEVQPRHHPPSNHLIMI
jgi:hypothetical protein